MFNFVILILLSYLIGSISLAYIFGKVIKNIDLRNYGSGNLGATNTYRILGLKWTIPVIVYDFFKGFIFIIISKSIDIPSYLIVLIGLSSILGHIFPIFLNFKGGKGVATSAGVITGIYPAIAIICLTAFILTMVISKKVSLASIITAAVLVPAYLTLIKVSIIIYDKSYMVFFVVISLLILIKHFGNFKRLLSKTENNIL